MSISDLLAINAVEAALQDAGVSVPGLAEKAWRAALRARTTGTQNGRAKLMPHQVQAIRSGLSASLTRAHLARVYGVSVRTISRIARGENWK